MHRFENMVKESKKTVERARALQEQVSLDMAEWRRGRASNVIPFPTANACSRAERSAADCRIGTTEGISSVTGQPGARDQTFPVRPWRAYVHGEEVFHYRA